MSTPMAPGFVMTRKKNKLDIRVAGEANIQVGKDANVNVDGAATVNVDGKTSVTSGGNATLDAPKILLNGGMGVVTGAHKCMVTGIPHGDCSKVVMAGP